MDVRTTILTNFNKILQEELVGKRVNLPRSPYRAISFYDIKDVGKYVIVDAAINFLTNVEYFSGDRFDDGGYHSETYDIEVSLKLNNPKHTNKIIKRYFEKLSQ